MSAYSRKAALDILDGTASVNHGRTYVKREGKLLYLSVYMASLLHNE